MATISPFPDCPPTLAAVAYENVCNCPGVAVGPKRLYLQAIAACGSDAACSETAHAVQVEGNARQGPAVDLLPDEGLGVLIEETAFIKHISPLFGKSIANFRKQVNAMVAYYDKRRRGDSPTDSERAAALSFMRTSVPPRSDGSIWLFRHPESKPDAFDGLLNEWLGHRLGLDLSPAGETRLAFGFLSGHVEDVRHPTFFDTTWRYLPLWNWEGLTRPLPGTPAGLSGLKEVVAKPPELKHIHTPVARVTLRKR